MWEIVFSIMRKVFGDSQRLDKFTLAIRISVIIIFSTQVLMFNAITITALGEGERYFYKLLYWFCAIMFTIWYYRATFAPLPDIPSYNSVTEDQYCDKWNNWKPMRARHCRMCDQWVPKMDHHCPWVANWIGYHNQKYFTLMSIYGLIALFMYVDTSIRFSFISGYPGKLSFPIRFSYWLSNCLFYPMFLMFLNLSINGIILIYNNVTTIDSFMGVKAHFPWLKRSLEKHPDIEFTRNMYDRLWLSNFWDVMGDSFWKWPLPIFHDMQGSGMFYPRLPDFDMNDLHHASDSRNIEQTMEMSESRDSVIQYARSSLFKYKNKFLSFEDKIYEVPENHPNMPNERAMHDYDDSD